MMNSRADTPLPTSRPMAKLMSPCPVAASPTVIAIPSQLSACSISTRVRGARRCTMARGAVTRPLTTTLSAITRITLAADGTPSAPASAGALR
jgi:hypothetical protein